IELLLGRQLAALGHDEDAELRRHILEQLDRDLVAPDPLDRLRQVELAAVDADALRLPDPVGDVGRRHRAEQRAGLAGADVEADLLAFELLHQLLSLLEALGLVARSAGGELLELGDAARRGRLGEPARQQVVAREAGRDVHDLAAETDLLDVLAEDDLHVTPRCARGRRARDVRRSAPRGPRPRTAAEPSHARASRPRRPAAGGAGTRR